MGESAARAIANASSSSARPLESSMRLFDDPIVVSACARSSSSARLSAIVSASRAVSYRLLRSCREHSESAPRAPERVLSLATRRASATSSCARVVVRLRARHGRPRYQAPCARNASASAADSTASTSRSASRLPRALVHAARRRRNEAIAPAGSRRSGRSPSCSGQRPSASS